MQTKFTTIQLTKMGMFVALIAICSWLTIPLPMVSFTLQTFAIYLCLLILGGKQATIVVITYLIIGAIGVPVFANMKSGLGVLFGTTGGYLIGFIFTTLVYWCIVKLLGEKITVKIIALIIGTLICYLFGTIWFIFVYNKSAENIIGLSQALTWCVIPFIIPDLVKIYFAILIEKRINLTKI